MTVAEGGAAAERILKAAPASMGPQLDSCGRRLGRRWIMIEKQLQWGRNLTVAEGGVIHKRIAGAVVLQWGRNLTVAEGLRREIKAAIEAAASMGPQLDSCGRSYHVYFLTRLEWLQWGRNLTVAEGADLR